MIELLSPAGNYEKLQAAVRFGADAVYAAGERFGMRAAAGRFTVEELKDAVKLCHDNGKRLYLTLNTMPHTHEYPMLSEFVGEIKDIGIDAFIIADMGVFFLVRRIMPDAEMHISTQASVVSAESARAFYSLGAKRVVLSRELGLDEIRRIREDTPDGLELEAFIHGAMCISYSGRCLVSRHFTGRDANCGECAQPCRWEYRVSEVKRSGIPLTVEESDEGTYTFGSRDLCMIEHIPELMSCGICSFKIEGRMKSVYYTAVTANTYRMAIDAYTENPSGYAYDSRWMRELESVSHREYDTGFFFDRPLDDGKLADNPGYLQSKAYLGDCISYKDGVAGFVQKNKASVGITAELVSPGRVGRAFTIETMYDENGNETESSPHPGMVFYIPIPFEARPGDILRA